MAKNSVISGLTVTIGADTKKYTEAIKEIDRQARTVAKDLKTVVSSLKLDPKDAESYADKMKLLGNAVKESEKKVSLIKQAIEKLNKEYKDGEAKELEYAKALATINEALTDGKIDQDTYKKNLEAIDATYKKGTISQEDYEKSLKELERQLESATYEYNYSINALDQYQRETSEAKVEVDKLGDEQKETNQEVKGMKDATDQAGKGAKSLGQAIKDFIGSKAVQSALKSVVNLAKDIVKHLVQAGKEIWNFSKSSVELAAQYQDAVETSKRAFQEFSADAIKFAEEQSVALGLYKGDMLEAMNSLGLMFSSMGLTREEAEKMSERVVILAADLRAAFGGDMGEILDALSRGLSTSTRNLRQFGVYISEAEIKAYALSNGIVQATVDQTKLNRALLDCEKAEKAVSDAIAKYGEDSLEARDAEQKLIEKTEKLNQVMEGKADSMTSAQREEALLLLTEERLADISGQAAAEADKYPALINRIDAAFKNMKESIGERLLPIFERFLTKFLDFLQSDEGQKILNSIADAFENIGKKVEEMLADGTLNDLINMAIEKAPKIAEEIGNIVTKVIDLAPEIFDLTEKLLALFGIKTEAYEAKEAYVAVQDELVLLAKQYKISTDDATNAVAVFAQKHNLHITDVYKDWEKYEPEIKAYMDTLSTDTDTMVEQITADYEKLPEKLQEEVDDVKNTDLSAWDEFAVSYTTKIAELAGALAGAWDTYCQPIVDWIGEKINWIASKFDDFFGHDWETDPSLINDSTPSWLYGDNGYSSANGVYLPSADYSSFGNSVSNVNNSRNVGEVVVNVASYGANAAEIADEIGMAVQNKLRMSGAML